MAKVYALFQILDEFYGKEQLLGIFTTKERAALELAEEHKAEPYYKLYIEEYDFDVGRRNNYTQQGESV